MAAKDVSSSLAQHLEGLIAVDHAAALRLFGVLLKSKTTGPTLIRLLQAKVSLASLLLDLLVRCSCPALRHGLGSWLIRRTNQDEDQIGYARHRI